MLRISKNQFEALENDSEKRFLRRLVTLILQVRPELKTNATSESLYRFSEFALEEARSLEFSSEFEIAVFCTAMLLLGKDFHRNLNHPMFHVVTRSETTSHLRANQLLFELEKLAGQESR